MPDDRWRQYGDHGAPGEHPALARVGRIRWQREHHGAQAEGDQCGEGDLVGRQARVELREHVGELEALGVDRRHGHEQDGTEGGHSGRRPRDGAPPRPGPLPAHRPGRTCADEHGEARRQQQPQVRRPVQHTLDRIDEAR